ncbi:hypothetical protein HMPREF1008_00361 [Olsenella sp. oral taxon 809 str. F0356]|nr:hypothetical protein HMPREF1008_00361 [Olsenella sp. oral taxon 809 str. F0356]
MRAATLSERTRIAREVHDGVGHSLTRLLLQVEALKVTHRGDERTTSELSELSMGLGEALSSMRTSVHALSDSAIDLGAELNRLGATSGIDDVSVEYRPDSTPPAAVTRTIVSLVRESLTNAARHARARHACVRVSELPGLWQVLVRNDGTMPELPAHATGPEGLLDGLSRGGMGLASMQEGVEVLGGTLRVSCNDEFRVFASIPKGRR